MSELGKLQTILRHDYKDLPASIARVAEAIQQKRLHEDPAWVASYDLLSIGPKNDWDGQRSAGTRASREWDEKVLNPAREVAGLPVAVKMEA